MGIVDLHVHSWYSDGMYAPREIAERAQARGVTLLAIADHDVVEGSLMLAPICAERGIGYLSAVEHSCLNGRCYHVLSYGAELLEPALLRVIRQARAALDGMSDLLIRRMMKDYPALSMGDYRAFNRDASIGGWKGIEYLMRRGVTQTLHQGMALYAQYGVRYEDAPFPSMQETIRAIHAAGGRAVLAHPGEVIDEADRAMFVATLIGLLELGLDGVECHYPKHSDWVRGTCLDLCAARRLMVTAGSDCHGSFSGAEIGAMGILEEEVALGNIFPRFTGI